MSILGTQLNPRSADFLANAAAMQALVDDLRARCEQTALGGNEARLEVRLPLLFGKDGLPQPNMQGPLRGQVRWKGAAGPLWSLLPIADQRFAGNVNVAVDLGGTLAAPSAKGAVLVDKGKYENLLQGVLLTNITMRLNLEEGRGGGSGGRPDAAGGRGLPGLV